MTTDDYRRRCRIAESCLPPAEYRTLLTALHDEMLAEIEALREALQEIVAAADGSGWDQLDAGFTKARAALRGENK